MTSLYAISAVLLVATAAHAVSVPPYSVDAHSALQPFSGFAPQDASHDFFYGPNLNYLSNMANHQAAVTTAQTVRPSWEQLFHTSGTESYILFSFDKTSKSSRTLYGLECQAKYCSHIIGYQCPHGANGPQLVDDHSGASHFVSIQGVHCPPHKFVSQILCSDPLCTHIGIKCSPLAQGQPPFRSRGLSRRPTSRRACTA